MVSQAKSTRNADHRHAQSIARQRQAAQAAATEASIERLPDVLPSDAFPTLPDASPANVPRPSWRDSEPAIVHSLKWRDSDGHEHLHIVRGDTLDEVLLHLRTVKAVIATARTRDVVDAAPASSDTVPMCPDHHDPMRESRYGGYYCPREIAEGVYCKRKVKGHSARAKGSAAQAGGC